MTTGSGKTYVWVNMRERERERERRGGGTERDREISCGNPLPKNIAIIGAHKYTHMVTEF